MNKNDFLVFVEALSLHLSNKEYILPQPIKMRWVALTRWLKQSTVHSLHQRNFLSDDTKLFDLMKVLSYYRDKDNDKIILDMQRTK